MWFGNGNEIQQSWEWEWEWELPHGNGRERESKTHSRTPLMQSTPYLPLPRSSPEGATTEWTVIAPADEAYYFVHGLLLTTYILTYLLFTR